MTPIDLSVILPCYRAPSLAFDSVRCLNAYMETTRLHWEIVVVDDGGRDFPDDAWRNDPRTSLIRLPDNRGKGAAVGAGMRSARGAVRVFTDVDLPYDLELLPTIVAFIRDRGFHLVIGDRTLPGASYALKVGWRRRLASALFSSFVGTMVTGGFFDTQCGLKGVRGDIADQLFPLLRLERFTFDVELIYIALKHGLDVKRVPVQLRNNVTSSVKLLRDSARGFVDVFRIKYHQLHGHYHSTELEAIMRQDFERVHAP